MTALTQILMAQIAASGPLRMSDYMAECLLHPDHGYYTRANPFGASGDFITAPEISQMFGEVIGLALAQAWIDQGKGAFALAELGPGRGTLMADIWRATAQVPGFHDAASIELVEASDALRTRQLAAVPNARHVSQIDDLSPIPLFLVANEFFDALPVRQFIRAGSGWSEVMIGLRDDALGLIRAAPAPVPDLAHRLEDTKDGDVVELCPQLPAIAGALGAHIATHKGAAIILDYGDWISLGDTVQAVHHHRPCDILAHPGKSDLTAHVDFAALARAVTSAEHSRLTPQGVFLERLGITARAQTLAANLTETALDAHIAAHRRLTHPAEMGEHFKVLGVWPKGATAVPGLSK